MRSDPVTPSRRDWDQVQPQADAAGDLTALFRARHADLVRLALLMVRDQSTAEDVVQDVFAAMQARAGRLPDGSAALAYARASVLNRCRSVLRRQALARGVPGLDQPSAPGRSAEFEAMLAEDRRQVLAALAALPPRRREVLVVRYYLGLSQNEIAAVLGISTGTVKSTAARALAALAAALGEQS